MRQVPAAFDSYAPTKWLGVILLGIALTLGSWRAAPLAAADVTATVHNGNLKIVGTAADDEVGLNRGDAPNEFLLFVDGLINGGGSPLTLHGVTGNVTFKLGGGNDTIGFGDDVWLPADLAIAGGAGTDQMYFIDTRVAGKTSFSGGGGDDYFATDGCTLAGGVRISTGAGEDIVALGSTASSGETRIRTGGGNDVVLTGGAVFHDPLAISTGGGADRVGLEDSSFEDDVILNGGAETDTLQDYGGNQFNGVLKLTNFE